MKIRGQYLLRRLGRARCICCGCVGSKHFMARFYVCSSCKEMLRDTAELREIERLLAQDWRADMAAQGKMW